MSFPRIAMLSPISWRTPPRHYGPWELVVSNLTGALVERGVDVTLFATADSITRAKLASVCPRPYSEDAGLDAKAWECLHIAHCFERAGEFDLIHNHFDFLPLSYSGLVKTPVLTTIHGFSSPRILPVYRKYNQLTHFVAISEADRAPELNYAATIHHGIRMEDFTFSSSPDDDGPLLFFGRIHPDKGAADAIAVAQQTGRRLILAGIVQDAAYFEKEVAPHLDGERIQYLGSVGRERRSELLGSAAALLHLIHFEEPFGLSVIEAMACGTPVIAHARGSMRELIQDGVNGFLVGSMPEAVAAVEAAPRLDRGAIRASVEAKFSVARMADDYLRVYEKIVHNNSQITHQTES